MDRLIKHSEDIVRIEAALGCAIATKHRADGNHVRCDLINVLLHPSQIPQVFCLRSPQE
ncbi:hypothetical protein [Adonisia turfae]|uniref:hypothetical protein n=1 Tax=Adonisia turfae TaxID=2950184 RepID=UPI0013D4CB3E|nr:hypothetical protein [Adonisia turfae]